MPRRSSRQARTIHSEENGYILLTGTSNVPLAQRIAKILKKELDEPISLFPDAEIRVRIPHNLRQRDVYIIQPTFPRGNDHIMQLIFMIDAARRASAKSISVVIPYFGYSRQDRKEMPRVPISSSIVARLLEEAGADRIITVDIHSEQQQGFTKIPWDNLYGSYALLPLIKSRKLKKLVVASPDRGGVNRATGFSKLLNATGLAIVFKKRDINLNDTLDTLAVIGEVEGKDILLVDDQIATGGTIASAANLLKDQGARSVRVAAVHGLFNGPALERISSSAIEEVFITDTIEPTLEVRSNPKIIIASVAPMLAEAIKRVRTGDSISRDLILQT